MLTGNPDDYESENIRKRIQELSDEEAFNAKVARVFGTPDGIEVAEWLLRDLCGYWRKPIPDVGVYEVGRSFIHAICLADMDIWTKLVKRRMALAEEGRAAEKKRFNDLLKGKA
jgi:hypothetical protein